MLLRKFLAVVALMWLWLSPVPGQAAPLYAVTLLPGIDFAPTGMNNAGQIVGWGCHGESCGLVRLDLASAVPEPGVAWLLAPGLQMLAARQCRMRGHRSAPA